MRLPWSCQTRPFLESPAACPSGARPPLSSVPSSDAQGAPAATEATDLACLLPLDVDNGYYTVKFDSLLLKEAVVEGDSILPPLRTDPTGSSDSDSGDADDPSYARGNGGRAGPQKPGGEHCRPSPCELPAGGASDRPTRQWGGVTAGGWLRSAEGALGLGGAVTECAE